jgi:EmrB/QacA subfamily drug resistance transporter
VSAPHPEQQVFSPAERRISMAAVMIVFFLSALDNTIVSTAMPKIVSQLAGLNLYAWVTTAYMLTSTVTVPIYGKFNDIYGRKAILIVGIAIFLFGSMLCGLAGEFGALPLLGGGMTQLVVFRAVQGLGAGALMTTAFAIISDLFPPRERAKFAGLVGSVFGLASLLGPVIGGFFTDLGMTSLFGLPVAGWRWVFYVNLPVGALALFMVLAKMPPLTHRAPGRIDFAGAALIVVAFVPLLLALSWGGRDYPWASPVIVGMFALSAAALAVFVVVENTVSNPIVSMSLFRNKVFTTANAASFVSSTAFMGSVTFLPLYMQLGQGVAATTSGLSMLPMMFGMILTSGITGRLVTRTGQYKPFMLAGAAAMSLGLFLLSRVGTDTSSWGVAWRVLILGIGLGPTMSLFNVAVQNAIDRHQIGVATSSTQFFRAIGGTVGVAVFGAVLTHSLATGPSTPGRPALDMHELQRLTAEHMGEGAAATPMHPEVRQATVRAVRAVFVTATGTAILALFLVSLIPVVPLAHRPKPEKEPPSP